MRQPGGTQAVTSSSRMTRAWRFIGLSLLLVLALAGVDLLVLSANNPIQAFDPHYYMALGNSLSFGYQPNFDFSSGFADDIYNDLHKVNLATAVVNYGCAGETTGTMINGGCAGRFAHKGSYTGSQLQAAVDFLTNARHQGRVSPVTLEIGANDVFSDFNESTCSKGSNADADLATMDANLTETILPALTKALTTSRGVRAGDLHMLNYYNPFAYVCSNSAQFVHILNDHLQADAAKFRVSVVDVYTAFGGDTDSASKVCTYTWMCDPRFHDIHPTNAGYRKIADAVEQALGLPGGNPLMEMSPVAPAHIAALMVTPYIAAFGRRSPLLRAA